MCILIIIMTITSKHGKEFTDFNWILYSSFYPSLKSEGYTTKDELWWHYINIGEQSGYVYFDINDSLHYLETYDKFDNETYITFIKKKYKINLIKDGPQTKDNLWWHYITSGNYHLFPSSQSITEEIINIQSQPVPKKTLYYFIHHTSSSEIRTGIQIVAIYLAKELIKLQSTHNFELIFVKWDFNCNSLCPCTKEDIYVFFHLDDTDVIMDNIIVPIYHPIHLNGKSFENCIFFCPEIIFVIDAKLPSFLKNYLERYPMKRFYILYDIIPFILPAYELVKNGFNEYFTHNLLKADKIITISEFTKNEFIKYAVQHHLNGSTHFPIIEHCSLPYQYRDNVYNRALMPTQVTPGKITILLSGTVEPRKQQITLMKMFNNFIEQNPNVDVQLIVFGRVIDMCLNEFFQELNLANGKIQYLGTITNLQLSYLYSIATFSCYVSTYEGFGFPIVESLWHNVPVMTSNFGSMLEVATAGGCYCIDTNSKFEIYNALYNLITNPDLITYLQHSINADKLSKSTWKNYSIEICNNMFEE